MSTGTFLALLLPGLATGVGGAAVLAVWRPTTLALDALLGVTAGIMLAATAFSLLVPALERGLLPAVLGGFALGAVFIAVLDRVVPHAHARFREHGRADDGARGRPGLSGRLTRRGSPMQCLGTWPRPT